MRIQISLAFVLFLLSLPFSTAESLLAPLNNGDTCPLLVKEGSSYTWTHTIPTFVTLFRWKRNFTDLVSWCYPSGLVCEESYDGYSATAEVLGDDRIRLNLTIHSVSGVKDATTWTWDGGESFPDIGSCDMEVYSTDANLSCSTLRLELEPGTQTSSIVWECDVTGIYPAPQCFIQYGKYGQSYNLTVPPENTTVTDTGDRVRCAMHLPVSSVDGGAGFYNFNLTIYPGLNGQPWLSSIALGTWAVSPSIALVLPKAELKDCPSGSPDDVRDGYIRKWGGSATCQCVVGSSNTGSPNGWPEWLDPMGQLVGEMDGVRTRTLEISWNAYYGLNPVYTCRAASDVGVTTGILFSPKFAYIPDRESQISLVIHGPPSVTQCDSTSSVKVSCTIPDIAVNPEPLVQLDTSGGVNCTVNETSKVTENGAYVYEYDVTPHYGGQLVIKCLLTNPLFLSMTGGTSRSTVVRAPPPLPPLISINDLPQQNRGQFSIRNGSDMDVQCRVEGGFPATTQIVFSCFGQRNVVDSSGQVVKNYTVTTKEHGKICRCDVNHETGCPLEYATVTFNVLYSPQFTDNTTFSTLSSPSRYTVNKGDHVTFLCEAMGNPLPALSVTGQRSNASIALSEIKTLDTVSGSSRKPMSCADTDVYICTADNNLAPVATGKMPVFVSCVPEFPQPDPNQRAVTHVNTTMLEVRVRIVGYPPPTRYVLSRMGVKSGGVSVFPSTQEEIDKGDYSVEYVAEWESGGTLVLTASQVFDGQSGQYSLTIHNGLEDGLDFVFDVTVVRKDVVDNTGEGEETEAGENGGLELPVVIGAAGGGVLVLALAVYVIVRLARTRGITKTPAVVTSQSSSPPAKDAPPTLPARKSGPHVGRSMNVTYIPNDDTEDHYDYLRTGDDTTTSGYYSGLSETRNDYSHGYESTKPLAGSVSSGVRCNEYYDERLNYVDGETPRSWQRDNDGYESPAAYQAPYDSRQRDNDGYESPDENQAPYESRQKDYDGYERPDANRAPRRSRQKDYGGYYEAPDVNQGGMASLF